MKNIKIYQFIKELNDKLMLNYGILAIIENTNRNHNELLEEIKLDGYTFIYSNILEVKRIWEDEKILEEDKKRILIIDCDKEKYFHNIGDNYYMNLINFIEHRRNHKLNIIVITNNINYIVKHLRESADFVYIESG